MPELMSNNMLPRFFFILSLNISMFSYSLNHSFILRSKLLQ